MYTYIDMCLSTDISCLLIDLSTDVTCLFWPQVSMMVIWDQFHRTSAHHSTWTNTSISASTCFQEYLASEFIIFICYSFFSDKGQRSFFRKFSMVPSLNAVKYLERQRFNQSKKQLFGKQKGNVLLFGEFHNVIGFASNNFFRPSLHDWRECLKEMNNCHLTYSHQHY